MSKPKKLNPRQIAFAVAYARGKNAAQAAIAAGYSSKTAKEIGYELLTRPHVLARVEQETEIVTDEIRQRLPGAGILAVERLFELLAKGDLRSMALAQAIFNTLEMLGLKPPEKQEISGPNGGAIPVGAVLLPVRARSVDEWQKGTQIVEAPASEEKPNA